MARFQTLKCPDCDGVFEWFMHHSNPLPQYCPLCAAYVGEEPPSEVFVPKAPAIGRKSSQDAVYRAMEEGSIQRAKMAADLAGVSESEMSHLKITDMKDNLREGDIAAVTRPNPVSTFMQQHPQVAAAAQQQGAAYAAATTSGPYPYAGLRMLNTVSRAHNNIRQIIESSGIKK